MIRLLRKYLGLVMKKLGMATKFIDMVVFLFLNAKIINYLLKWLHDSIIPNQKRNEVGMPTPSLPFPHNGRSV
jgi:hypothetical protein